MNRIVARKQSILWARALLKEGSARILDSECTGLNREGRDEPVEITIINLEGKALFNERLLPTVAIDAGAAAVHGIRLAELQSCKTLRQHHAELSALLNDRRVVIFNADYDSGILDSACRNQRLDPFSIRAECCMLRFAAFRGEWNHQRQGWRWATLDVARQYCGIPLSDHSLHSALGDTLYTLEIVKAMANASF